MNRSCILLLVLVACTSNEGVDVSDRDPRCVTACTGSEPPDEGVGRVCDAASREQCLDECEARIANVTPICQSCLVERACFGPDGCFGDDGPGGTCTNDICTISSEFGSCTFNLGDQAGRLRCYQQVDPRREVACTPAFRPTTECASVCI